MSNLRTIAPMEYKKVLVTIHLARPSTTPEDLVMFHQTPQEWLLVANDADRDRKFEFEIDERRLPPGDKQSIELLASLDIGHTGYYYLATYNEDEGGIYQEHTNGKESQVPLFNEAWEAARIKIIPFYGQEILGSPFQQLYFLGDPTIAEHCYTIMAYISPIIVGNDDAFFDTLPDTTIVRYLQQARTKIVSVRKQFLQTSNVNTICLRDKATKPEEWLVVLGQNNDEPGYLNSWTKTPRDSEHQTWEHRMVTFDNPFETNGFVQPGITGLWRIT